MPKTTLEAPPALTYDQIASWSGLSLHPTLAPVLAQHEARKVDIVATREQLERLDAAIKDDEYQMDRAIAHGHRSDEPPLEEDRAERTRLSERLRQLNRSVEVLKQEEQDIRTVVGEEIDAILRSAFAPVAEDALTHLNGLLVAIEHYDAMVRIGARLGRTMPPFADANFLHRLHQLRGYWQQRFL